MPILTGKRLGPYEILSAIGAGGMGEVYRARDTRLDRIVAIKVLPTHLADRSELRERFEREARTIASLNHPHICTLYDVGHQDGTDFLVMEYLEGETLAQRLIKGPLPLDHVLQYAIEIADALDKAHRKGVTHRDLKPGNIMLTKSGTKLLDFGLAKLKQEVAPANVQLSQLPTANDPLTAQGAIVGTLQYMAPEQLEGKEVDARTDIFAFGAVVYEMATGKKAFEGKSQASVLGAILKDDPPPISALQPTPPQLDRVVKKCLAKEPERRWQAASDVCDELSWIAQGGSQAGVPAPITARRKILNRPLFAVAAITVMVLALALLYLRRAPMNEVATMVSVLPPANAAILLDSAPAISPDGRRLAFVARDSSSKSLVWVRPLDSLTAQPLAGTEEARQPFWSPDSRFIGFFSQGKVKKVDASGGPPQILCDASSTTTLGGTWNQDGVIAFAPTSVSPIETVPSAGGPPKAATALDRTRQERGHFLPYFLPDGRHFLYLAVSGKRENIGIYVGSLDSKDTKRLLDVQSEVRYAPPGYLLFVRDSTLMAQRFDASRLELSGDPFPIAEQVISNPIFGDAMFSVSGNGVLAYRSGAVSGDSHLMWFDRTGKQLGTVGPPGEYLNPQLSPDGKRVAFERRSAQGDRDIWLLELLGGTITRFTFNPADDYYPIWSPDGSRIVFASTRDGSYGLYQKPSSGVGNEEPLLKSSLDIAPFSWSSDGRFIVYRSVGTKGFTEVWVLPLFGDRKPFPFLQSEFSQSQPQLSPDGRWLSYYSNESGRFEVYIQSFPKPGGKWQVSTSGGIEAKWSRDGKYLFYLALDGKLMAVGVRANSALEVGTPKPLFEPHIFGGTRSILGFRYQFDVARDGQRFLINVPVAEESSSPITLVLNWAAGPKK